MTPAIRADDVSYRAGSALLVDAVSATIASGEVVGIVGPNGAGKSTLLGLLAGDLRPTGGTILLAGRALGDLDHAALAITRSVLPQHRPADVPFTVRDVVAMGRHPLRRSEHNSAAADDAAVADAMRRTDAAGLAGRTFSTLSGGEQSRVSMARVLAQSAPIMLLDEPTAALDVAHEMEIWEILREEAIRGRAVVLTTHHLNLAARYADRLVLLEDGRARATGAPGEVLTADTVSRVYGWPVRVEPLDEPGRPPQVLPLRPQTDRTAMPGPDPEETR
jgi:iron complex transport system ATP-binding protein